MEGVLQKIRAGELNDGAKEAIVKGLFPLDPLELISAIYFICVEKDALLPHASETFGDMNEDVLENYFEDRHLDAQILHFFLVNFAIPAKAKSAALLNQHLMAKTLLLVSPTLEASLIDLAVNNQVKILEEPGIIDALLGNPAVSINQAQKLEEYKRLLLKDIISPEEELVDKPIEEVQAEAIQDAKKYVETFGKETKPMTSSEGDDEEEEPVEERRRSILEQVQHMSVPQKVQGAIKGDREMRSILVRDANKLVSSAVIRSPRITESEIEFYANLRNVHTDVLRLIASNREWLKSYKVVLNLVKNPRTPLTFTTRLLNRINKKDLRLLIKDRNVPEALRTIARRKWAEIIKRS